MSDKNAGYHPVPIPRERNLVVDSGRLGRTFHTYHLFVEADVTGARRRIKEFRLRSKISLSFSAFIASCLGMAIDQHRVMNAVSGLGQRMVIFDDVDIMTLIEADFGDRYEPVPYILRNVNKKPVRVLHNEIRAVQAAPELSQIYKSIRWFPRVPALFRRVMYWGMGLGPKWRKHFGGTVLLINVGMFSRFGFWAAGPGSPHTLRVILGGFSSKPGIVDGEIVPREYVNMTISFDHDLVDGAPAVRFMNTFVNLVENCYGLDEVE